MQQVLGRRMPASDLEDQIIRAHLLAARCLEQLADGDLPYVDRESSETRAVAVMKVAHDLEALTP